MRVILGEGLEVDFGTTVAPEAVSSRLFGFHAMFQFPWHRLSKSVEVFDQRHVTIQ
jgi:hypothetical protein